MSSFKKWLVPAVVLTVSACSSVPRVIDEYKIDVQQGNVLTQEMVSQLRPGLTRDQVRYALGSPVLTDIFHNKRWDYVYYLQRGDVREPLQRQFSVFFDAEGKLDHVEGDLDPAAPADLSVPANRVQILDLGSIPDGASPAAEGASNSKGWWSRLKGAVGF